MGGGLSILEIDCGRESKILVAVASSGILVEEPGE